MLNELREVYSLCFDDSKAYLDYAFFRKFSAENCLYHREDGRIVSEMFVVDKRLSVRDLVIDCPYICGVCTLPDYRKRGYADLLLNQSFELLKQKGFSVCALHPFRHSFYEKFGFITYNKVRHYMLPQEKAGGYAGKIALHTGYASEKDIPLLLKLYTEFTAGLSGYAYRDSADMKARYFDLTADGHCKLIYREKQPVGYAFYDGDKFIAELCLSQEELPNLSGFEGYTVNLPANSSVGELQDFTMIKILDRKKFAESLNLTYCQDMEKLSDLQIVHLIMGSYNDFDMPVSPALKAKFSPKTNYVFDKY